MFAYLDMLEDVMKNGSLRSTRNAVTKSVFPRMFGNDMRKGFPLLTTKQMPFKTITTELCWFLRGERSIRFLEEHDCHIWDANVRAWQHHKECQGRFDAGRIYGVQWRRWHSNQPNRNEIDQIQVLVDGIINRPYDRRHIVSAWRPDEIHEMCLPPCHILFQCYCDDEGDESYLDLAMYQRSADLFLGVPFNIASYGLLLEVLAQITGRKARYLKIVFGDLHIYKEHFDVVDHQLGRIPRALPKLHINPEVSEVSDLRLLSPKDFSISGYNPHSALKANMVV